VTFGAVILVRIFARMVFVVARMVVEVVAETAFEEHSLDSSKECVVEHLADNVSMIIPLVHI
jgi:hypothetical protein